MKRVARPRGWPKKVLPPGAGVSCGAASFVRLDAMVDPCSLGTHDGTDRAPGGGGRHRRAMGARRDPRPPRVRAADPAVRSITRYRFVPAPSQKRPSARVALLRAPSA